MKLSVAIATYNEQDNLKYAIGSTIDWVDEVVVVDGSSTDETVKKAKAYGSKVRVIEADNPVIFHVNKQKAIEAAQGEWILQLDADEEVTDNLRNEIIGIINSQNPNSNSHLFAYEIPRRNFFLGRPLMKGGVYPDYTTRLYRRGTMYFPCKDVHENVKPIREHRAQSTEHGEGRRKQQVEGNEQSGWLGRLENPLNHYSDPTLGRYLVRWGRYCHIESTRVLEKARKAYKNPLAFVLWKLKFIFLCIFVLPSVWFVRTYVRHKGFMDGWQGLLFHTLSAFRWWGIGYQVTINSNNKQ